MNHRNLDMTSHYEEGTKPCLICKGSQFSKIHLTVRESYESLFDVIV